MEPTRAEVGPTYQGHIESTMDARLLFERCLTPTGTFTPHGPFPGGLPVQNGHVFILHDINGSDWDDGRNWTRIGEDNIGFEHFELSSDATLRKKTWTDHYRHQRFGLVAYYTPDEQFTQRPSQDSPFLASMYKEQSFWFDAFKARLEVNRLLEDMNSCSADLIHETGVDENRSRFVLLAFSLMDTLEKLGREVSTHVMSSKDSSKGTAVLDERALSLIEHNRSTIWEDYGLAAEITSISKWECFNEFDSLTEQLLEKGERHTLGLMGCLERREVGAESKMLP